MLLLVLEQLVLEAIRQRQPGGQWGGFQDGMPSKTTFKCNGGLWVRDVNGALDEIVTATRQVATL